MKELEEIRYFCDQIFKIDYFNREGGRYAYLQFLYYTREIVSRLEKGNLGEEVKRMMELRSELNEQVGERFGKPQQIIFVGKQIEIREILDKIEKKFLSAAPYGEPSLVRQAS